MNCYLNVKEGVEEGRIIMCLRSRTRDSHYIKFACAEIRGKCIIERIKGGRKQKEVRKKNQRINILPTRIVSRSQEERSRGKGSIGQLLIN